LRRASERLPGRSLGNEVLNKIKKFEPPYVGCYEIKV
jgi:hypothetical protein